MAVLYDVVQTSTVTKLISFLKILDCTVCSGTISYLPPKLARLPCCYCW